MRIKLKKLTAFILIGVLILGCAACTKENPPAPAYAVYETDLFTISVPEDLETYVSENQDYDLVLDGEKVIVFIQSVPISDFTDDGYTLEDIRDAIYDGNDVNENGLRYMAYTSEAEGIEYFFVYSLLNDNERLYDVTLACLDETKDLYRDEMLEILSGIEMKNE